MSILSVRVVQLSISTSSIRLRTNATSFSFRYELELSDGAGMDSYDLLTRFDMGYSENMNVDVDHTSTINSDSSCRTLLFSLHCSPTGGNSMLWISQLPIEIPKGAFDPFPMTLPFKTGKHKVSGELLVEVKIEAAVPKMEFKKKQVDLAQLYDDSKSTSNLSANLLQKSDSKKNVSRRIRNFKFGKNKGKVKGKKFGVALDQNEDVPGVVRQSIQCLEQGALNVVGLFRESAGTAEIGRVKQVIESGKEVAWAQEPPHVVAGVLMTFLLELPEPLVTFDLYDSFIAAQETVECTEERAKFISKLIRMLLPTHRNTLCYLMGFLNKLTAHSEQNKMSASNLAICFGPALMRKEVADVKQIVADSPLINSIVQLCIEEFSFIFMGGDMVHKAKVTTSSESVYSSDDQTEKRKMAVQRRITQRFGDLKNIEALMTTPINSLAQDNSAILQLQDACLKTLSLIRKNLQYNTSEMKNAAKKEDEDFHAQVLEHIKTIIMLNKALRTADATQEQILSMRIPPLPEDEPPDEILQRATEGYTELDVSVEHMYRMLTEDLLFTEVETLITETRRIASILFLMKGILDKRSEAHMLSTSKVTTQNPLVTARQIIVSLSKTLEQIYVPRIKQDLESQVHMNGAVIACRVIRAFKQALREENREILVKIVRPSISQEEIEEIDKEKLASITDIMQYSMDEIEVMLEAIASESENFQSVSETQPLVQLLVAIKKFLDEYLSSEARVTVRFKPASIPSTPPHYADVYPLGVNRIGHALTRQESSGSFSEIVALQESNHVLQDLHNNIINFRMELEVSSSLERAGMMAKFANNLSKMLDQDKHTPIHTSSSLPQNIAESIGNSLSMSYSLSGVGNEKEKLTRFRTATNGVMDRLLAFESVHRTKVVRDGGSYVNSDEFDRVLSLSKDLNVAFKNFSKELVR